jgi:L-aminopeptidase/D-esterase-like protein
MRRAIVAIGLAALWVGAGIARQSPAPSDPKSAGTRGLTEVQGITVGSFTLSERPTGCTVILVDGEGVSGGVSQRGAAPATAETDVLQPLNMVDKVNAVVLSGGSAFGLETRNGVMRYLEERKIGWKVSAGVVPIVPQASLIDLSVGNRPDVRPNAECGYKAAEAANTAPVAEGNVGAGAGGTVGKMGGGRLMMKGGLGSTAITLPNGLVVAAIVATNGAGDVIDPKTGAVVAGVRTPDGRGLADIRKLLLSGELVKAAQPRVGENTTIGLVATNAGLTKTEINRVALMADDGFARAINPSHTTGDGDTVFALATGRWEGQASVTLIGALAAEALAEAVVRAVSKADSIAGIPSAKELGTVPARLR